MTIAATAKCGRNRGGIGLDLGGEILETRIAGRAMDLAEHLVHEVRLLDVGGAARQHGWSKDKH